MSARVRTKRLCYISANLGVLIWSVVNLLDGISFERTMLIFLISLIGINLLLWFLFRAKENGSL